MKITKYTTKYVLLLTVLMVMISCKNDTQKATSKLKAKTEVITDKPISLIGKKLEYNYGSYVYHLEFKTEDKLHWKCVEGDEKGKEADETYTTQRLDNYTLFLSWIEADGLGVSQVLNLKENTINCYLKIDRQIVSLNGTVKEL